MESNIVKEISRYNELIQHCYNDLRESISCRNNEAYRKNELYLVDLIERRRELLGVVPTVRLEYEQLGLE